MFNANNPMPLPCIILRDSRLTDGSIVYGVAIHDENGCAVTLHCIDKLSMMAFAEQFKNDVCGAVIVDQLKHG